MDRESKGVVESANQFLETSFLPGRVFASAGDFNNQFGQWLPKASARLVRRIGARPADLVAHADAATGATGSTGHRLHLAGPVAEGLLRPGGI